MYKLITAALKYNTLALFLNRIYLWYKELLLRKIIAFYNNINLVILINVNFVSVEMLLNETNLNVFVYTGQLDLIVDTPGESLFCLLSISHSLCYDLLHRSSAVLTLFSAASPYHTLCILQALSSGSKN